MNQNFKARKTKRSLNGLFVLLIAALTLQLAGCTTLKQPSRWYGARFRQQHSAVLTEL
jgi:hypothetical protein